MISDGVLTGLIVAIVGIAFPVIYTDGAIRQIKEHDSGSKL